MAVVHWTFNERLVSNCRIPATTVLIPMPELFENAFNHASVGMALVGLDGRWLVVNPSVSRIVGYSEAELFALTFQDITHPEDLEKDLAFVAQLLRGEIEDFQMEKRYFHKAGHVVWVLLSVSLARGTEGQPLFFISQFQDITARKEGEIRVLSDAQEKQRLYDELRAKTGEGPSRNDGLVTVCPWTKKVRDGQQWVPLEEFLSRRLRLRVSHGMSDEAAGQMIDELHRPGEH